MPNSLAYVMLLLWPLACLALFRRLPLERAIIWCSLGGYLLLPPIAEFDLPLVPDMDKYSIPSLSAYVICVFVLGKSVPLLPQSRLAAGLIIVFVLSVIPTVLTNTDPISFGVLMNSEPITFETHQLPALRWRDLGSVVINQILILLPFLMARRYLSTETGLRELLLAFAVGGLFYSLPSLFEIRFSPQLNIWIYGFFQHSWEQMVRNGGFRPIVFLPHGLWLAFFMVTALLGTAALLRNSTDDKERGRYILATAYLFVVLVACKSLASLAYGIVFLPLVLFTPQKLQIKIALSLALIGVLYPMLRNLGWVPLDDILAQANAISPARAHSLNFRFENEEVLLDRAQDKTWFGWGGWGRNLVRHHETGQILSVPDGRWIIVFGTYGWVGYIAEMGLLATPLGLLVLRMRKAGQNGIAPLSPWVAPIALILAVTMMDMLLNATLTPLTWMCAGAILGYAEQLAPKRNVRGPKRLFGAGASIGSRQGENRPRTLL